MTTTSTFRVVEREMRVYRRLWRGGAFSTFVIPLIFLLGMGRGLGGLIDNRSGQVAGMSYMHFITPGLMAAMAMQSAAPNALWPVMAGFKWVRFFHGIVATPVGPADVYGGYVTWCAIKSTVAGTVFIIVATLLGGVVSPWGVLAIPASVLCTMAFLTPLAAYSATQTTDISFSVIMRVVIMPLFLFSGAFFPVSQLPGWLQVAVRFSPLWHAVELCRSATTGSAQLSAVLVHTFVLVAIAVAGWMWGTRTFAARLSE